MHGPLSITAPGAVAGWAALAERHGRLGLDAALADAIDIAERGFAVTPVIAGMLGRRRRPLSSGSRRRAACSCRRPASASSCGCPSSRRRCARIAERGARRLLPRPRRRGDLRGHAARARTTSPCLTPTGSSRCASTTAASTCARSRPTARASPRCRRSASSRELDHTGGRALDRVHLQAEAMKLAFADAERHVHDGPLPARYLDDDYLASRRALIDPARAGAPAAGRAAARRHRLPVRGRRAAQRLLADPERLPRVRLARRRAGHRRRAAEPRALLHARGRAPQPARAGQAPVPHDHPRPAAARRRAARPVRRDGRPHAAAGPPAGRLAPGRSRPRSRRPRSTSRAGGSTTTRATAGRWRSRSRSTASRPRSRAAATGCCATPTRTASAAARPCSCATTS